MKKPLSHRVFVQPSATCGAATSVDECVFLFALFAVRDPLRNIVGPRILTVSINQRPPNGR